MKITCLYLGVINFIYMFPVWYLIMLMVASGIVGSSEVKLRQQTVFFRSISSRVCVRVCVAYALASRLHTSHLRMSRVRRGWHWQTSLCTAAAARRSEYPRDLISKMAVIRSRAAFAERCPRPKSYRPPFRRHRSSHVQRSTADIPALDFMLGPATHWSHTTPACRHRSSPRT